MNEKHEKIIKRLNINKVAFRTSCVQAKVATQLVVLIEVLCFILQNTLNLIFTSLHFANSEGV